MSGNAGGNVVKVQLDWGVGEEHLPLLYLNHLIEVDRHLAAANLKADQQENLQKDKRTAEELRLDDLVDFKLVLLPGTGSEGSLKAIEHEQCEIALSNSATFLVSCRRNGNILTVGRYITRPPIAILADMKAQREPEARRILAEGDIVPKEGLGALFNNKKIGVFSNSAAKDLFRHFAHFNELRPRSIVIIENAFEFGTSMFHNVPFLVCYEYNQGVEVLWRKDPERFRKILLREKVANEQQDCTSMCLQSTTHKGKTCNYSLVPGVVFAANCSTVFNDNPKAKNIRKNIGNLFLAMQKVSKVLTQMDISKLASLARHISKYLNGRVSYLPARETAAANGILHKRLMMLKQVYWETSIPWQRKDHTFDPMNEWQQLGRMCGIDEDEICPATTPGTGVWCDIIDANPEGE